MVTLKKNAVPTPPDLRSISRELLSRLRCPGKSLPENRASSRGAGVAGREARAEEREAEAVPSVLLTPAPSWAWNQNPVNP